MSIKAEKTFEEIVERLAALFRTFTSSDPLRSQSEDGTPEAPPKISDQKQDTSKAGK